MKGRVYAPFRLKMNLKILNLTLKALKALKDLKEFKD